MSGSQSSVSPEMTALIGDLYATAYGDAIRHVEDALRRDGVQGFEATIQLVRAAASTWQAENAINSARVKGRS